MWYYYLIHIMKKISAKKLYILILIAVVAVLAVYLLRNLIAVKKMKVSEEDFRSYHVMVVGKYENRLFMQQLFNGAEKLSKRYDSVVELNVPHSVAEDKSLQELFDYSGLLNVDGIIAYVDSDEEADISAVRTDGSQIPVVTTGMYMTTVGQISYIGTSWWEVGKRIGEEAGKMITDDKTVCIIGNNTQNNPVYSSLMNSLQRELKNSHSSVEYDEIQELSALYMAENLNRIKYPMLIICVTEAETLKTAQVIADLGLKSRTQLIGYGNSEPLMLYLNNGIIKKLVCVDSENIGETAMKQLYEYRSKGYANSYVAADIRVIEGDVK